MSSFLLPDVFPFVEAGFTAFLVAVLIAIRPYFRSQTFFCRWMWAWTAHAASLAVGLWSNGDGWGPEPLRSFIFLAFEILSVLFIPLLIAGAESFRNSGHDARVARRGIIAALAGALALYILSMFVRSDTLLSFEIRTFPPQIGVSGAFWYCSYVFFCSWRRTNSGGSLLAMLSCGCYGAMQTIYIPLTIRGGALSVRWIAIDTLCQGGIAIATLLLILEREAVTASTVRDSEQRYRLLFERNLAGVFRSRADGTVIDCNEALCKMLRYSSPDEFRQNSLSVYFSEEERSSAFAALRGQGQLVNHELRLRRKDGSEMLALINVAILSEASAALLELQGTVLDVSETRRLQEQLLQSQKMEAVGQLAGGIAHDFNNLLMVISGQTELLLETAEAHDVEKAARNILFATESAGRLTKKLLAFSRKQGLANSTFNLNQLVTETTDLINHLLPKNIDIDARLSPTPCWVNSDRVQMEQTLVNLSLNARDAMPEGGKLVISVSAVVVDDACLGLHGDVPAGAYAMITVADTGHGIAERDLGRIFEPFFTTKPKERGTGLGLSIAYGIVSQSGGHIRLRSTVGAGTTFSVYIPSVDRPRVHEPKFHPCPLGRSNASCPREGTILVVDDEEMLRASVRAFLDHNGLTVLDCGDASEAVNIASELKERLALLVTDVVMPKMTGTELAHVLVTDMPELSIIFMSGYAAGENGHEQFNRAKFLQKPFTRATLLDAICEGLRTCPRLGLTQN